MAYSKEKKDTTFEKILLRISEGEALRNILKDNGMPSSQTFFKWIDTDELKSKQYTRATEFRAEAIFEEALNIADAYENDIIKTKDGQEIVNNNVINRDRLRVDTRKWFLSKLMPKKFGEKLEIDQNIKHEKNEINLNINGIDIDLST